jgi:hypothetical protein
MKLPSSNQITALVVLVCLAAFYFFIFRPFNSALHHMATGRDAEQGSSLGRYVLSKVTIDGKSSSDTNAPPVEMQPSRNSVRLDFFGVTNSDRQEQIISAVKDWQTTNQNMAKLWVRFYQPEKARGQYGQHIEPLLRETFLVLSNAQFDIILNSVAPKN